MRNITGTGTYWESVVVTKWEEFKSLWRYCKNVEIILMWCMGKKTKKSQTNGRALIRTVGQPYRLSKVILSDWWNKESFQRSWSKRAWFRQRTRVQGPDVVKLRPANPDSTHISDSRLNCEQGDLRWTELQEDNEMDWTHRFRFVIVLSERRFMAGQRAGWGDANRLWSDVANVIFSSDDREIWVENCTFWRKNRE